MSYRADRLSLAAGLSLVALATAGPSLAATPNPTPNLRTGDYQANWGSLTVADPTIYARGITANQHPTTVHYDAASGTYVFNDGSSDISFSRSEYVAGKSSAAYTYYRDTSTGATLKILNQSATNPVIALTYVTYAKWSPVPQSPIIINDNYVVFGTITPSSAMPRTGSASYNAILDGTYRTQSRGNYTLSGSGQFVANFAAGSMAMTLTALGTASNGSTINFGTLSGAGFINASDSSWNATSRTRAADGTKTLFSANGNFFGPQANEIGASFTLTQTLGTQTVGAGAGAVVGKKN